MPNHTKNKNSNTVLGKTPKKKTTLSKLVNSPSFSPDFSGDGNVSAGELAAEAGLTAVGGKLAAKALSKIGGKSVGKLVTKFANKMFPSSGKNIVKAKKKYALDDFDVSPNSSDTQREMVNILHKIDKAYSPPKPKSPFLDKGHGKDNKSHMHATLTSKLIPKDKSKKKIVNKTKNISLKKITEEEFFSNPKK